MTIEEKRKKIRRACYRLLGVPHNIPSLFENDTSFEVDFFVIACTVYFFQIFNLFLTSRVITIHNYGDTTMQQLQPISVVNQCVLQTNI
jgi:hypothetical protein